MSVAIRELQEFASLDFWGQKFILEQAKNREEIQALRKRKGRHALRRDDLINASLIAKDSAR
jgi:hypothetical protein